MKITENEGHNFEELSEQLGQRCDVVGIEFEIGDVEEIGKPYIAVFLPNGRDKKRIILVTESGIISFLKIPFEKFVCLGPYQAICSYDDGAIEAGLRLLRPRGWSVVKSRLLGEAISVENDDEVDTWGEIEIQGGPNGCTIKIGDCSDNFDAIYGPNMFSRKPPTLKITGVTPAKHDEAQRLLEKLSDALFFQLDVNRGISLNLMRDRRASIRPFGRYKKIDGADIVFPTMEYDRAPLSLYWYARSAFGMPLLQFLAYYQVIEFYMPVYYRAEAARHVRTIVKSPDFRPERDADISKIINALAGQRGGSIEERTQLKATLNECIDAAGIRSFITEHQERSDFLSTKTPGLTDIKIPVGDVNADLRNPIADRIYQIRCAIVHTKQAGEASDNLLLPYSRESELLYHDIELVEFLAQRILAAASTPLTMP